MCRSCKKACACGERTAEIFFGRDILNEKAIKGVYCPKCSGDVDTHSAGTVYDNGWVLELDMDVITFSAPLMGILPGEVTADRVFDEGYATWVGITPNESETRDRERAEILKLAEVDLSVYLRAMKKWGMERERRFTEEGWRKMQGGGKQNAGERRE